MTQLMLAGKGIGAEQDVRRLLCDAEGERRNGARATDSEILVEHLVEALTELDILRKKPTCTISAEERRTGIGCDIEPSCAPCALAESQMARDCGLTPTDRESGKACPVWGAEELEKCCACQLADEKRERAAVDQKSAGEKATHTISTLRSDLAIAGARLDCGMDPNERAAYKFCLRSDLPGGDCATCAATKMQREIAGLKNTIDVIREERDGFLIEAQVKATPVVKPKASKVPALEGGNLFDLMPQPAPATPPKAKRKRRVATH